MKQSIKKHLLRMAFLVVGAAAFAQTAPKQYTITPQFQEDPGSKHAREIIDRTIQALGGDAYENVRNVYQEGRTSGFSRGNPTGAVTPFWRWLEFPDKERIELLKSREWILIYSGDKAWDITYHGDKPMEAKDLQQYLQRRVRSLDAVLRQWVKDPKTIYFFDGELFAEAKQTYSVTLINGSNESVTLMVDKRTYLPVKKTWSERDEYKEKFTEVEIFDQYREIQGIQTPFVTSRSRNDSMTGERFLQKVVYNKAAPDEIFKPEYKKPAPQ